MKIVLGPPVVNEDFFDRKIERRRAWRKLDTHSLLMLAPRRVGKTSLMLALIKEADSKGFKAAPLCRFAGCKDEWDCVQALLKAIGQSHKSRSILKTIGKHLKPIKSIKLAGLQLEIRDEDRKLWRQVGEGIIGALQEQNKPWLICVDEVPVFINRLLDPSHTNNDQPEATADPTSIQQTHTGRTRAADFLNWFRDLRQASHRNVRWILAGSIGMDTIASRLHLSDTINDLDPFPLGAFDSATADEFLLLLAKSYQLNLPNDAREEIIHRVGWPLPYYLELLLDKLIDNQADGPITPAQVADAYQTLLTPAYKVHFDYWRQRLHEELDPHDAGHCIALLSIACADPQGVRHDSLKQALSQRITNAQQAHEKLRYLLDILESDGYLIIDNSQNDSRYRFRLNWLRDYWKLRVAA